MILIIGGDSKVACGFEDSLGRFAFLFISLYILILFYFFVGPDDPIGDIYHDCNSIFYSVKFKTDVSRAGAVRCFSEMCDKLICW